MRSLLAMAIFGLAVTPVEAADLYGGPSRRSIKDEPYTAHRPHVWTGAYFGVHAGFTSTSSDSARFVFDTDLDGQYDDTVGAPGNAFSPGFCGGATNSALPANGCGDDEDSLDFGIRVGYDRQYGQFVFGGLIEVNHVDISDSTTAFSTTPAFYTFTREVEWSASMRLRAGLAMDRLLIYATGGATYSDFDETFRTSNAFNNFTLRNRDGSWGYVIGGGAEYMIMPNISLGLEYLYTDFGSSNFTARAGRRASDNAGNVFNAVNPVGTDMRRTDDALELHSVRATLTYRFN